MNSIPHTQQSHSPYVVGKLSYPDLRIEAFHLGKVRNAVCLSNGTRIIQTSNRVSAFDVILPFEVPEKAEILQALSLWFFEDTKHIVQNHIIGALDKQHLLVKEAQVLPFEFVVRGVLTGSLWRLYSASGPEGVFRSYGIQLPAGLQHNQVLPTPILTPTTKASSGHDTAIGPQQLLLELEHFLDASVMRYSNVKVCAEALLAEIREKCLALFERGQLRAQQRGLFLADTKYEFGLGPNGLMLVDEVHTPDSSRYWYLSDQHEDFGTLRFVSQPRQLSKEFLRLELTKIFGNPADLGQKLRYTEEFTNAEFIKKLSTTLAARYQEMFSVLLPNETPFAVCQKFLVPWPLTPKDVKNVTENLQLPEKILIAGNGGRDFSLYQYFAQLPEVSLVFCAPGNRAWPGSKYRETKAQTPQEIAAFAKANGVGLVISGPELYLAQGLQEACAAQNIPCLGPDLYGAELEASKILCKKILEEADIPTAQAKVMSWSELQKRHSTYANKFAHADSQSNKQHHTSIEEHTTKLLPCALKYDCLASGKGVFICHNQQDLDKAIDNLKVSLDGWQKAAEILPTKSFSKERGEAHFLVEDLLQGEEVSVIALCNKTHFRLLPIARDYKRRNNNQTGPNTGGMGTAGPIELPQSVRQQIVEIFQRTLDYLAAKGSPYTGFLFAGLMIDSNLQVKVIEFNCRLGDPETQVILPGLSRDFAVEVFQAAKRGPFLLPHRSGSFFAHDGYKRVFVVGASPEYPFTTPPQRRLGFCHEISHSAKDDPNTDLPNADDLNTLLRQRLEGLQKDQDRTHALEQNKALFIPSAIESNGTTSGGRAFGILASGKNFAEARACAYQAMELFSFWENGEKNAGQCKENKTSVTKVTPHFRTDIALELLD